MNKNISQKRAIRNRKKLKKVSTNRYRISIFRSSHNISAQIIDDKSHKTLVSASSLKEKNNEKIKKTDMCVQVASILAKKALDKKITQVYFDRGRYRFHGRVKVFADTLRKNGLVF